MPDSPYSVLSISILCLLFYSISVGMVRLGIISSFRQRKIWNTLLLLSIAVAGSIGILLAITVNFKINLPVTDQLLVWHVDFGTALVLIAVFHFSWHIKYYRFIFNVLKNNGKNQESTSKSIASNPAGDSGLRLRYLPFSLGFTAMATQLILMREFLSIFNGNELTIGIMLANWMLLTGLGGLINRKTTTVTGHKTILTALFLLAVIPVIALFLIYWLRNIVVPVGSLYGLGLIITGTFVLLAPFCLLSGWLFSAVSRYLSGSLNHNAISLTYGWETLGSLAAGVLCSMVLVFLFEPFQNLAIVLLFNSLLLGLSGWDAVSQYRKKTSLYIAGLFIVAAAAFIANFDNPAMQFLFPGQEIVSFKDTPYGKLMVTRNAGQLNFFENNTLLFTTNNIISNEEVVHYALLQHPVTGNVLLLGGSISGVADECLKYPLKRLDCVEINPGIHSIGKAFNLLPSDKRFRMQAGDPRLVVKKFITQKHRLHSLSKEVSTAADSLDYEAIILDLPEPNTLQVNRFYTLEFLAMLKNLLVTDGIVSLNLMPTADYIGSDALKIQSAIYQTLKAEFRNVLVIPGEKNYFLASDGVLTAAVATLAAKRGIKNEYVNGYYLDDASLLERSENIMMRISVETPLNLDFKPVGCFRQISYWLGYAGDIRILFFLLPLILVILIAAIKARGITVALFSAGCSSFSLEIILILTFQVLYGYIYLVTGIFITLFMAGLALGVMLAKRFLKKATYPSLVLLQLVSAGIILMSLAAILFFRHFQSPVVLIHIVFSLLLIFMAITTGTQFHIASMLKSGGIRQVAATNYAADLIGSAAGALLVNAWLVPFWGFTNSLVIVACANVMAIMLMLIKKP